MAIIAVAEHTFASISSSSTAALANSIRTSGRQLGRWASAMDCNTPGRRMGIIGLAHRIHRGRHRPRPRHGGRRMDFALPPEHFDRSGATPVDELNKLIEPATSSPLHLPLNTLARAGIRHRREPWPCESPPHSVSSNTLPRSEVIESGALLARTAKGRCSRRTRRVRTMSR